MKTNPAYVKTAVVIYMIFRDTEKVKFHTSYVVKSSENYMSIVEKKAVPAAAELQSLVGENVMVVVGDARTHEPYQKPDSETVWKNATTDEMMIKAGLNATWINGNYTALWRLS